MKNESVWNKYLEKENKKLENNIECDVLIIGGGISGILTAYNLNDSNLKVLLVDRNNIGSGISSKMTAKVTILQDILTKISDNYLSLYLKSQIDGLKILENNIKNNNIKCDFLKNDSYLFTTKNSNIKKLKRIEEFLDLNRIKYKSGNLPVKELNSIYSIKIDNSYEINPIKYINSIKKLCTNINIFENTNITQVLKENSFFIARCSNNKKIIAKKVVFATNYPYFLKPLFFPLKVRLEKSFIGYGKSKSSYEDRFNAINIDKKVYSIRFYKDKMIYLTNSKLLPSAVDNTNLFKDLSNNIISDYENIWSNIDIVTNDYLPIVGEALKNLYIITGYNTWGVLSSHISASIIASLINKDQKYKKYKELFNPRKKVTLKKFVNSSINVYENMYGFLKGIITKNSLVFYSKNEAMYIDKDGSSYVVKRKCPHMKCNLIFNEVEKTWDCPCHASRFDLSGKVISGPSKYSIRIDDNENNT